MLTTAHRDTGRDEIIVCRCEEVTLGRIVETALTHRCSAREVKLRTRAAMGYCGGRVCRPCVDAILQEVAYAPSGKDVPLKIQTPVRPIALAELGSGEGL